MVGGAIMKSSRVEQYLCPLSALRAVSLQAVNILKYYNFENKNPTGAELRGIFNLYWNQLRRSRAAGYWTQ